LRVVYLREILSQWPNILNQYQVQHAPIYDDPIISSLHISATFSRSFPYHEKCNFRPLAVSRRSYRILLVSLMSSSVGKWLQIFMTLVWRAQVIFQYNSACKKSLHHLHAWCDTKSCNILHLAESLSGLPVEAKCY
jgi:hypothetical protein